ncbi:MAG: glucose-6-phosphate isomerase [Ectothiorhodospiraceae bacterium]|nr:glucose-6-phosphate isomerase [Ectothiorhodospiraceae bacterium]
MTDTTAQDRRREAWTALEQHATATAALRVQDLFAADAGRFSRMSASACGLLLDYSKHRVDAEAMTRLLALADAVGLRGAIDRLFAGEHVNTTEDRPALHMALRHRGDGAFPAGAADVMGVVRPMLGRMRDFAESVREGRFTGFTGEPMRTVVNIGIGGSDLGPSMVTGALARWHHPRLRAAYVSNLDATQLQAVLANADPRSTLFVVASKSFSTEETLTNARSARAWLVAAAGGDEAAVARHFVAVSSRPDRTTDFGIDPANVFEIWDWVGGRYSLWSAIGLSTMVMVGADTFERLLAGADEMDAHFRSAPLAANLPVLMGLLGVWCRCFLGASTHAVLAYDYALRDLPAHLQQLEMESNGKRVTHDGAAVDFATCPVVWGGLGNNGQHAYYQLLHQGRELVPCDFLVPARTQAPLPGHDESVIANALAQAEALMRGRDAEEARAELAATGLGGAALDAAVPHRVVPGNQPSSTIVYRELEPEILGALVALYEHKVFVQGTCWGVNSFDQWGVELGKVLAARIRAELVDGVPGSHDGSTAALLDHIRALR